MKKIKTAISLLLVLLLCLALTVPAFAAGGDKLKYVSLGDSSTNGYGLEGFDFSFAGRDSRVESAYIFQFPKYLEKETGRQVEHTNLCLCGMRTNELAYALDEDFGYDKLDAFGRNNWGGFDASYPTNHYNGAYKNQKAMCDVYSKAIAEADVITYDLGSNNFGNYLIARVSSLFGVDIGFSWEGYTDEHFNDLMAENNINISIEMRNSLTSFIASQIAGAETAEQLAAITDAVLYAFASFCLGFNESIDRIYELNPDVKLIVFGMFNTIEGERAKYNGMTIDIGAITGFMMDMVNEYIISVNEHKSQYAFADLKDGVQNVIQSIASGVMYNDLRDDLLDLFYSDSMLGRTHAQALINELSYGDGAVTVPATLQNAQKSYRTDDARYAELRAGVESVIETFQKAAAYTEPLDMDAGLPLVQNGLSGLYEVFIPSFKDFESASQLSKNATHLILNLLVNGTGAHPSEYGHQQKLDAAITAYESSVAADGTHFVRAVNGIAEMIVKFFNSPNWFKTFFEIIRDYFNSIFSIIRFN